jgi:predicted ATPase
MTYGITRIAVEGFKSISKKQSIDIAPLTIQAGANSSGKSSIMQPLLLLKQTLDAPFDPGPLFLSGGNIQFTSSDQFLSKSARGQHDRFSVEIAAAHLEFDVTFSKRPDSGLDILEESLKERDRGVTTLRPNMSSDEIRQQLGISVNGELSVVHQRFFLNVKGDGTRASTMTYIAPSIENVIHVPGLRGSRSRFYAVAAIGRSSRELSITTQLA